MTKKLNLQEKVEIANLIRDGYSDRQILDMYETSKGSIYRIKKEIEKYTHFKESNGKMENNDEIKESKHSKFTIIDEKTFSIFQNLRAKNITVDGKRIRQIALNVANNEKITDFKASNGWITRFLKRNNIKLKKMCGQSRSADHAAAEAFIEVINEKMKVYEIENIYNYDETGIFFKAGSNKSYVEHNDDNKGIKERKDRITVLLTANMSGELLEPLVIGKFKNPRVLKNVDISVFNVQYTNSKSAWMNSEIFKIWIYDLNEQMKRKNKNILLIGDNSPTHENICLSNIEHIMLPKNTTSLIQPLDMGIIKAFKNHYQNFIMDYCYINENKCYEDILKEIDILDALKGISYAAKKLTKDTIKNCFLKAFRINRTVSEDKLNNQIINSIIENEINNQYYCLEEIEDNNLNWEEAHSTKNEFENIDVINNYEVIQENDLLDFYDGYDEAECNRRNIFECFQKLKGHKKIYQ